MKVFLIVVGVILILVGGVWFFQGINMFPGESFMNGSSTWEGIGLVTAVAGALLVIVGIFIKKRVPKK